MLATIEKSRSSQEFVSGDKTRGLGVEVPSGVQGQSPGGGLEAKRQNLKTL